MNWSAGKLWIACVFRQSNWGTPPSLGLHEEAVEGLNCIQLPQVDHKQMGGYGTYPF